MTDRTATASVELIRQHLIDPEICIRCNTCEATCPTGAITHDDRNYVVKRRGLQSVHGLRAAVPDRRNRQLASDAARDRVSDRSAARVGHAAARAHQRAARSRGRCRRRRRRSRRRRLGCRRHRRRPTGRSRSSLPSTRRRSPPWSAAHAFTNLYGPKNPTTATVVGNFRVTEAGTESDTHHIVLDFGSMPFPVLEGQSIGIVPPGTDAAGRAHHARQYSIASPRNGERPGYNNASLTVKRVTTDHQRSSRHAACARTTSAISRSATSCR